MDFSLDIISMNIKLIQTMIFPFYVLQEKKILRALLEPKTAFTKSWIVTKSIHSKSLFTFGLPGKLLSDVNYSFFAIVHPPFS